MIKKLFYSIMFLAATVSFVHANQYSVAEIYNQMCSNCHGLKAEGNPEKKGPSLNDMSKNELEMELYDLQSDGFQSSGSGNEVMSHNQQKIEDKGMIYHPEDMANYIYHNFNTDK